MIVAWQSCHLVVSNQPTSHFIMQRRLLHAVLALAAAASSLAFATGAAIPAGTLVSLLFSDPRWRVR
jgi:hypothetical protein